MGRRMNDGAQKVRLGAKGRMGRGSSPKSNREPMLKKQECLELGVWAKGQCQNTNSCS